MIPIYFIKQNDCSKTKRRKSVAVKGFKFKLDQENLRAPVILSQFKCLGPKVCPKGGVGFAVAQSTSITVL